MRTTRDDTIKTRSILALQGGYIASPAGGMTYHFGDNSLYAPSTPAGTFFRCYFPFSCQITKAIFSITTASVAGSNETSSAYIRKNNAADTLISSSIAVTTNHQSFASAALDIAITAGDFIEIKWISPAWAAEPSNLIPSCVLEIQAEAI